MSYYILRQIEQKTQDFYKDVQKFSDKLEFAEQLILQFCEIQENKSYEHDSETVAKEPEEVHCKTQVSADVHSDYTGHQYQGMGFLSEIGWFIIMKHILWVEFL